MSKVRCFKGSAAILGERILKFPGVGGRRWSLCVGTRKVSVTARKGFGVTLTWGWSVDFQDALKVRRDVRGSVPTVGNRCGWVEALCFRGSSFKVKDQPPPPPPRAPTAVQQHQPPRPGPTQASGLGGDGEGPGPLSKCPSPPVSSRYLQASFFPGP